MVQETEKKEAITSGEQQEQAPSKQSSHHHSRKHSSKGSRAGSRGGSRDGSRAGSRGGTGRGDIESQQQAIPRTVERPTETQITDLSVYEGDTLEERIECLIKSHKVAIFEKTWCLFSRDAKEFLMEQLGVSIHSVPVDELGAEGKQIVKYLIDKTKHKTTPVIFITGQFLGGFEEVNGMYSTGELEREYLKGLTQADRCELEIRDAKNAAKPLLWFPEQVNAHVVRITGVLTCIAAALSVGFFWMPWGIFLGYGILLDFVLRIMGGARFSILGNIATLMAIQWEPKPRQGRPKQFAACCGFLFSFLGCLFYSIPFPYHGAVGAVFMGMLAFCCGMEGFLDFCLGCFFFKTGIQLGLIPE